MLPFGCSSMGACVHLQWGLGIVSLPSSSCWVGTLDLGGAGCGSLGAVLLHGCTWALATKLSAAKLSWGGKLLNVWRPGPQAWNPLVTASPGCWHLQWVLGLVSLPPPSCMVGRLDLGGAGVGPAWSCLSLAALGFHHKVVSSLLPLACSQPTWWCHRRLFPGIGPLQVMAVCRPVCR